MTQSHAKSEVASAYDEWAETYDTDPNLTRDLAAQALKQADLNFAGRRIIEVGCGTGRNTKWLVAAAGAEEIVALDFSEEMLTRARNRVRDPRVRFVQHDVRSTWPMADASADVVIAMLVLEHVEMLEPFFAEAARSLSEGGELLIFELHPTRQLLGGRAQFTNAKTGERRLVPAFLHSASEYVNAGLASGFELEKMGEWRDEDAPADNPHRVLSLHFLLSCSSARSRAEQISAEANE
jgi:malonyl-CoA O-methyltransferase